MKQPKFLRYYLFSCLGILLASCYPFSMGIRVIADMLADGVVLKENYPKYIIPYTPMCIGICLGTFLMPIFFRRFRRYAFAAGALTATAVFFGLEFLFEQKVVVASAETVATLEDWQMFLCVATVPKFDPAMTQQKTQTAVEILIGDYNPAFKLHFYVIAVVLIFSILNCLYGFGQLIQTGEGKRKHALILQSVCAVLFLGLCILACFTAFWRDGNILVSPLSAVLMAVFFILMGVTTGVFAGSFLLGKGNLLSVGLPAISASAMTLLMYLGEMILLQGHLYRFGTSAFFRRIPGIVLAPVDLLIIVCSGALCLLIFACVNRSLQKQHT